MRFYFLCYLVYIFQLSNKSYLENRKQFKQVINATSDYLYYNVGVPQGSMFSPLLFRMYVNDLLNVCPPDVFCQIYADDIVLYVHAKSQQQAAQKFTETMNHLIKFVDLVLICMILNSFAPPVFMEYMGQITGRCTPAGIRDDRNDR